MRAATPTAAAELACADAGTLKTQVQQLWNRLQRLMVTHLQAHSQTLDYLARRLISPMQQVELKTTQINQLKHRMDIGLQRHLQTYHQQVSRLKNSLEQLNPQNVLARGYSLVYDANGELVSNSQQLKLNEPVKITLHQGGAHATITKITAAYNTDSE